MGQETSFMEGSEDGSLKKNHSFESFGSVGSVEPTSEELKRHTNRVKLRIKTFRVRAGTYEICNHLLLSWNAEKDRIQTNWKELSDPARRSLIMNAREKVVQRGKILHSVVAPQAMGSYNKNRRVRKLMEHCAFELFDTSIVYNDIMLPQLIEDILSGHGGGEGIPVGLALEVDKAFEQDVRRLSSTPSIVSEPNSDTFSISNLHQGSSEEIESGDESCKSPVMVNSRSVNSIQGYFSQNEKRRSRHSRSSRSIRNLLSFVPTGLDPVSRKSLTLELLLEMRNAFLVHFAILVFSELFDDKKNITYKYEYDSESDTACEDSGTDCEEVNDDNLSDSDLSDK